jgi:hypothetical protein
VASDAVAGEGKLIAGGSWPRRNVMAVSSSATAEEIEVRIAGLPAYAQNGRRELLEPLQSALATFTKTQYARDVSLDSTSLDAALNQAVEAARALASERIWPKPYVRRWFSRGHEAGAHSSATTSWNGAASTFPTCNSGIAVKRASPSWLSSRFRSSS